MSAEKYQTGLKIRKEVLGKDYVETALGNADEFNHDFQKHITEYYWGGIWGRGVLSKPQRSLNSLCMLAALNRPHEFKLNFRGALRSGCEVEELRETLLQITAFCGVPAGIEAFRIAREVFKEEGIEIPAKPISTQPASEEPAAMDK